MRHLLSEGRRKPAIGAMAAVVLIAAALSACATAPDATAQGATTPGPTRSGAEATVAPDAPATLFVPANLSVSSIDGEAPRPEPTEAAHDPSLSIPPGLRTLVVEWIGPDGASAGQLELTKAFEAGRGYRLLRARTSVFLLPVE